MLKPVEMEKVRVLVMTEYFEEVIRECGELGIMEIRVSDSGSELGKYVTPTAESEELKKAALLEKRVGRLIEIMGVEEKTDLFGAVIPTKKTALKNENTGKQLARVEDFLKEVEEKAITTSERMERLEGKRSFLLDRRRLLRRYKKNLKRLVELGGRSEWLGDSQFLYIAFGSLPQKDSTTLQFIEEGLKKNFFLWKGEEIEGEERLPILILVLQEDKKTLEQILGRLDWKRYDLPPQDAEEELQNIKKTLEDIDKEKRELSDELRNLGEQYGETLLVMKEIVENGRNIFELTSQAFKTEDVNLIEGWVPRKKVDELRDHLEEITDGHLLFRSYPEESKNAPTHLENPSLFKPFESLTSTFGLPNYNEVDPTVFLAFTFPLFYGMMFGDVGHGALLALLGVAFAYLGKRSAGIKNLGIIIVACGVFSVLFGFLYGDIFGLGPHEQEEVFGSTLVKQVHFGPMDEPISPIEDPMGFLMIAVGIAVFHISLGLIIDFWNKISKKKFVHAFTSPFVKLWLYYGALSTIFFGLWDKGVTFPGGISLGGSTTAIFFVLIPALVILFSELIKHAHEFNPKQIPTFLGEGGFEVFDTLLLFVSNTISYSRLFALALVHAGLFMALFSISHLFKDIAVVGGLLWLLTVIVGTVIILTLEAIIVFLHSLRLHYYEWFSKFFGADGIPFKPFKIKRVYTYVKE